MIAAFAVLNIMFISATTITHQDHPIQQMQKELQVKMSRRKMKQYRQKTHFVWIISLLYMLRWYTCYRYIFNNVCFQ